MGTHTDDASRFAMIANTKLKAREKRREEAGAEKLQKVSSTAVELESRKK